jgi:Flp pilus assembly protein TadB
MPGGGGVLTAVVLAAALAAGAPVPFVAIAAVAVWRPLWFLAFAATWGIVARRKRSPSDPAESEAAFLRAVAAELRSGASLRRALVDAAGATPPQGLTAALRSAAAGRPMDEVADRMRPALPVNGSAAAAAIRVGATTGAATAAAFGVLAARAGEMADEARERRALTAQARLSALLVGVVPMGFAVVMLAVRGDDFAAAGTAGVVLAATGLALDGAGLVTVWAMLRRAER